MIPRGQIEVNFRGLDTDIFYDLDEGQVDWWFADPMLNVEVTPTLLEEQRIIDACLSDSDL